MLVKVQAESISIGNPSDGKAESGLSQLVFKLCALPRRDGEIDISETPLTHCHIVFERKGAAFESQNLESVKLGCSPNLLQGASTTKVPGRGLQKVLAPGRLQRDRA